MAMTNQFGLLVLVGLLVGGCVIEQQTAPGSLAPAGGHWLKDASSGCQFWAVEPEFISGNWSGACVDGYASGQGVVVMETALLDKASPWTLTVRVRGAFDAGKPNGVVFSRYSSGVTAIATYEYGRQKGDMAIHYLRFGEDSWVIGPRLGPPSQPLTLTDADSGPKYQPLFPGLRTFNGDSRGPLSANDIAGLFDFSKYDSVDAARAAIDHELPAGRKSEDLLSMLDTSVTGQNADVLAFYYDPASRAYCKHKVSLVLFPNLTWYCVWSTRYEVANGNVDQWTYVVLFDDAGTLLTSEVRRFFKGKHFLARKAPLRADNFQSFDDFVEAARQVLGPTPSRKSVADLMESAGLKQRPHPETPEALEYDGSGTPILYPMTGCVYEIGVVWMFDPATDRLLKVNPGMGGVCL